MSNFSYIDAIPLPILDITNTGKTIRDFDVDIATRIKKLDLILQGEYSPYYNSNPETDTIGSNWPVGMSFEELCYFYWKVGYFNWGGTSAKLPFDDGSLYSWGGSYSPAAYPRISKILNDNCTDYLQKGDLYYAVRIINHYNINQENLRTCSFYNIPENEFFVYANSLNLRIYDFGDGIPSINFDFCIYNPREVSNLNTSDNLQLIAFWHPFAYLNNPASGGSGNPMDIFNFFPRIIKNENLYYPSIYINSLLGFREQQYVLVRTFDLMSRSAPRLVYCQEDQGSSVVEGIDEQYVSETKSINFEILNTPRSLFVFSTSIRIIADGCSLSPINAEEGTLGNILGMKAYEEQPN